MKDFGQLLLVLGAASFVPTLFNYEWVLTSWLGDLQAPVGLAAMAVGGVLFGASKLQQFRNAPPVTGPTDVVPNQLSGAAQVSGASSPVPNQLSTPAAPPAAADEPRSDT